MTGGEIIVSKTIFCIDIKSFYASVECVDRGLNPFLIPLVVADKERGNGSIVLAVSPALRADGVPSRLRIFELPKRDDIVFAKPRMKRYLEISAKIVSLYLDYVGEDDLHIYSVDECFLDVTHYLKFYNLTPYELAMKIKNDIYKRFSLTVTIGIGHNLLVSKLAMDIEAKQSKNMIAQWNQEDIKSKLWKVAPLSKMWGISRGYERKLNRLGIYSVGDLANYPKQRLHSLFGVKGDELSDNANGIDYSDIRNKYIPDTTSFTSGQVFFRDYHKNEMKIIIEEMLDDLLLRLLSNHLLSSSISLTISYAKPYDGGFSRQCSLPYPTCDQEIIFISLLNLFNHYIEDKPIRMISLSLGKLTNANFYQLNLFSSTDEQIKKHRLFLTIAKIKDKYGKNSILRGSSKLECSSIYNRHNLIGGHAL